MTMPFYKPIRSFVKRQGRLSVRQRRGLVDAWPKYGLNISDGLLDYQLIFPECSEIVLEIGFGMGDTLLETAVKNPNRAYIGAEVHEPGIGSLLAGASEHDLSNIRVYKEDVCAVMKSCLPKKSLDYLHNPVS